MWFIILMFCIYLLNVIYWTVRWIKERKNFKILGFVIPCVVSAMVIYGYIIIIFLRGDGVL